MKTKTKKFKASIIIVNYNNEYFYNIYIKNEV